MTDLDSAHATLNSIGDAVLTTDLDGHVTYLNLKAEAMTGWTRESAAGRPLDDVFHIINRESRETARDPMRLAMQLDQTVTLTPHCVLVRRDGTEIAIEDSAAPIHDADGSMTGAVIVFRDVGSALETSRRMSHLALHDALTGLPNRLLLHDRLTEAIALGQRRRKPVAVLFLDLDGFKGINDSLGHAAGDGILKSMAARLKGAVRLSDTVGRHGGDEFVVVLSEIDRPADAMVVAGKLLAAANAPHQVGTVEVGVTASVGVAVYPDHGAERGRADHERRHGHVPREAIGSRPLPDRRPCRRRPHHISRALNLDRAASRAPAPAEGRRSTARSPAGPRDRARS